MNMVIVDTSGWFAALVPSDPDHEKARAWLASNRSDLLVTDYIIDELLTLLRYRKEHQRALEIGGELVGGTMARVEWVIPTDVQEAWAIFRGFQDQSWSFTECVSRAVMSRLEIRQAFSFADHFRQFGTVTVVP